MGLSWMIYVHQHSEFLKIFAGDLADWPCLDELLLVDERGVKPRGSTSHIFSHGIHTFVAILLGTMVILLGKMMILLGKIVNKSLVVVKFADGASSLWLWHILNMSWR